MEIVLSNVRNCKSETITIEREFGANSERIPHNIPTETVRSAAQTLHALLRK